MPTVSKISTKDNDIADLSRTYIENDAKLFFERENLPIQQLLNVSDSDFSFKADW